MKKAAPALHGFVKKFQHVERFLFLVSLQILNRTSLPSIIKKIDRWTRSHVETR